MPEIRTLREYLLSLNDTQRVVFLAASGAAGQSFEAVVESIRTPDTERAACRKIKQLFGVTIPTAEERAERIQKALAALAAQAAEDASNAATAAERSSQEASAANAVALQTLALARRSVLLAAVAVVVAVTALTVSLFR